MNAMGAAARGVKFCNPDCLGDTSLFDCRRCWQTPPTRVGNVPERVDVVRTPRTRQQVTYTYLIGAEGSPLVKIGKTKALADRLTSLQTGQPVELSFLWHCEGAYEKALHQKFAAYRVRGEWFDLTSLGDPIEVVRMAIEEVLAPVTEKSP